MNDDSVTIGGLVSSAIFGFACGAIGGNGWTHGGAPLSVINAGKNAFSNLAGLVGLKSVLKLAIPPIIFGGFGGGIYGRISSFYNPNGNFVGI